MACATLHHGLRRIFGVIVFTPGRSPSQLLSTRANAHTTLTACAVVLSRGLAPLSALAGILRVFLSAAALSLLMCLCDPKRIAKGPPILL